MTGPTGKTINANAVTLLCNGFGDQVGVANRYAPDEARRAEETAGRTGIGIDEFGILVDLRSIFSGKLCKHRTTRVAVVFPPRAEISFLILIASKRIAD